MSDEEQSKNGARRRYDEEKEEYPREGTSAKQLQTLWKKRNNGVFTLITGRVYVREGGNRSSRG